MEFPVRFLRFPGGGPAWVSPPSAPVSSNLISATSGVTITGGTGAVLGTGTAINIATNALNQNGLVTGTNSANTFQVWGTDAAGNPGWRDVTALTGIDNGLYYNSLAGKIRQGGALVENTAIPQGNFNFVHELNGSGNWEVRSGGTQGSGLFVGNNNRTGIGTPTPASKTDIEGNISIGSNYSGSIPAPAEGAIIEGSVGIGIPNPVSSAKLHISATDKGVLIPNIALTATNSGAPVTLPQTSLLVYNTATAGSSPFNVTPGYYYWDGSLWQRFVTGNSGAGWQLDGNNNAILRAIGTNDNFDLPFETNATEKMRLTTGGRVLMGTTTSGSYPFARIEVADVNGANSDIVLRVGGGYLAMLMQASNGGIVTPTARPSNSITGIYEFQAHNGAGFQALASMGSFTGNAYGPGSVSGNLTFSTRNTTDLAPQIRMTVAPDGNVGIGSIAPVFKLDVSGTIRANNAAFTPNAISFGGYITGNSTSDGHRLLNNGNAPGAIGFGYVGQPNTDWFYMYSDNFVNTSSRSKKKDITTLNEDLYRYIMNDIDRINPAFYRYKGETAEMEAGNETKYRPNMHLGVILEETPDYLQDQAFFGVDIYSLGTLSLAGVKHNRAEIRKIINHQVAGKGEIKEKSVWINFPDNFEGDNPIVNITPTSPNSGFYLSEVTDKGFRVEGNSPFSFNWFACSEINENPTPDISPELMQALEVAPEKKALSREYWNKESEKIREVTRISNEKIKEPELIYPPKQ